MAIFKSLIKAILLLQEGDAEYKTLIKDKFEGSPSHQFVIEKLGDLEYRMWLADKFFIFYLNRSKQYQNNGRSNIQNQWASAAERYIKKVEDRSTVKKNKSLSSRYQ